MSERMPEHYGDVLTEFIESRQRSSDQLANLSGIPKQTIVSWREGRVKRPRSIVDILRVGQALHLSISEINRLLLSARHEPIDIQRSNALANEDDILYEVSQFWPTDDDVSSQSRTQIATSPFTAPRPTHAFVGRRQLLADAQASLGQGKVTTLWGMPGIGKSEVAKMLAHSLKEDFSDGVLWASLNSDSQSGAAEQERCNSILGNWLELCGWQIGGEKQSDNDIEMRSQTLRTILNSRSILVVLDNVESSETIQWFMPAETSDSALLLTTRNRRVAHRYGQVSEVTQFEPSESVELLQQIVGEERLTQQRSSADMLVNLLDGHPLALSIVGHDLEETPSLTIHEYAELLVIEESRLDYLSDWEDETKDIQKVFELSYRRLPPKLQNLYIYLSLLGGDSFDSQAAAAVTGKPLPIVKKQMGQLAALALLEQESYDTPPVRGSGNNTSADLRYRFNSLLRLFADGKRAESELDVTSTRRRMAEHYITLAASANRFPFTRLRLEHGHLLDALNWSAEERDWALFAKGIDSLTMMRQGAAGYLDHQGAWPLARERMTLLLDSEHLQNVPEQLGKIYLKLALFAQRLSDTEAVKSYLEHAERYIACDESELNHFQCGYLFLLRAQFARHQGTDDPTKWMAQAIEQIREWNPANKEGESAAEEGFFLIRHGSFLGQQGEFDAAKQSIDQGLDLLPDEPSPAKTSALTNLGILHTIAGQTDDALEKWQLAMETARLLGDLRTEGELLNNMGAAESRRGRFFPAIQYKDESLLCARTLGDIHLQILTLCNLGEDYTLLRDFDVAQKMLGEANALAQAHNQQSLLLLVTMNQLRLCLDHAQDLERATSLYNEVHQLNTTLGEGRHRLEILRLKIELDIATGDLAQIDKALLELVEEADGEPLELGLAYRLQGISGGQQQKSILPKRVTKTTFNLPTKHLSSLAIVNTSSCLKRCFRNDKVPPIFAT